jgi:putative oxidoreductase
MKRLTNLITSIVTLSERIGNALRWASPVIARLTVGLVFLRSGWGKLHDLGSVTNYFTELGLPAPGVQATLASSTELVCGALMLIGLATRFAALPLIVVMCVAIRTALWDQVEGIGSLVGLLEFAYIALLFWLATDGAGPLSVDRLIADAYRRRHDGPSPGVGIVTPSRVTV